MHFVTICSCHNYFKKYIYLPNCYWRCYLQMSTVRYYKSRWNRTGGEYSKEVCFNQLGGESLSFLLHRHCLIKKITTQNARNKYSKQICSVRIQSWTFYTFIHVTNIRYESVYVWTRVVTRLPSSLPVRMQSWIGCICWAFLQCVFSNVSSNANCVLEQSCDKVPL